jgi:hypothetical protein
MRPSDVLFSEAIEAYAEHFSIIVSDLRSLPSDAPVIAEATALLPGLVVDHLRDRNQAVWLVPSEGFQRSHYRNRDPWVEGVLGKCSEPERAFANWMGRDAAFARWVAASVMDLGLHGMDVDGSLTVAETAALVAGHFGLEEDAITRRTGGRAGYGNTSGPGPTDH